ncbi:MAG: C_GCAxxG_C_C family protein [Clostridia bacterium]|nr:C_GCAxxG_C_C family protein [Clostridia bacterium]
MTRQEKAKTLFLEGYNCSQAVLGAFCDVMDMDFETAMKLASSFGGGVARMRHICGTCSAMFMVAGALRGNSVASAKLKSEHYALIQDMAKSFAERNGSIICHEILSLRAKRSSAVDNGDQPLANERTEEYYRTRPCLAVVEDATRFTCEWLGIDETCPDI